jgi:hypothetical protein
MLNSAELNKLGNQRVKGREGARPCILLTKSSENRPLLLSF